MGDRGCFRFLIICYARCDTKFVLHIYPQISNPVTYEVIIKSICGYCCFVCLCIFRFLENYRIASDRTTVYRGKRSGTYTSKQTSLFFVMLLVKRQPVFLIILDGTSRSLLLFFCEAGRTISKSILSYFKCG